MNQKKSIKKDINFAPNIAFWLPNIIGYIRLILIVASWKFALNQPEIFTILYGISYSLDAIDGNMARLLGQTSYYGSQVDILVDRISTSTLLFVVLKLGLLHIEDELEKMKHAFFFSSLFLIDFVSHWFQVYSNYLVGNKDHTSNERSLIARFYYSNQIINGTICFFSELYVFQYYMKFFPNDLQILSNLSFFPLLLKFSIYGCIFKNIVNFAQLYSSSLRIVSLDVAQKNKQ